MKWSKYMIKSVWLSNLIVDSMNRKDSVLYSYYCHINDLVNPKESMMQLYEPNDDNKTIILVSLINTCIIPKENFVTDEAIVKQVKLDKKPIKVSDLLYCPLFFENISTFGILVFKVNQEIIDYQKLVEALIAFSSILYSESMGSIVKSYHETTIECKDICVDYKHGKLIERAINNVSLKIYENEFTVIVGPSGCGKSSLLNVIGGMRSASSGKVSWNDKDITMMTEKEKTAYRSDVVGFIFQRYNLINDLTAIENVNVAASLVKDSLNAIDVLDMVGLKEKANSYPNELSGGEAQRVCIARALVKKPKLLLCDEPTGALDSKNALAVIKILKDIAKNQRIPVVVITHNPNFVVLADHCISMVNGKIVNDYLQPFALDARDLM